MSPSAEFGQVVALFFFAVGVSALAWPYKLQAMALEKCKKFWGLPNPFLGWMATGGYIWMLRTVGAFSVAAALFVESVILFR